MRSSFGNNGGYKVSEKVLDLVDFYLKRRTGLMEIVFALVLKPKTNEFGKLPRSLLALRLADKLIWGVHH